MLLTITSDFTLALCAYSLRVPDVEMDELMFFCIVCDCVCFVFVCICIICVFVIHPLLIKLELSCV